MEFFDSHAHYNDEKFKDDRDKIILENYNKGIRYTTCIGYNLQSSKDAIDIAKKYCLIKMVILIKHK